MAQGGPGVAEGGTRGPPLKVTAAQQQAGKQAGKQASQQQGGQQRGAKRAAGAEGVGPTSAESGQRSAEGGSRRDRAAEGPSIKQARTSRGAAEEEHDSKRARTSPAVGTPSPSGVGTSSACSSPPLASKKAVCDRCDGPHASR